MLVSEVLFSDSLKHDSGLGLDVIFRPAGVRVSALPLTLEGSRPYNPPLSHW